MNSTIDQAVKLLEAEIQRISAAVQVLKSGEKRRGRPPKALPGVPQLNGKIHAVPKKRGMSEAARKRRSKQMKAYWADRKKHA